MTERRTKITRGSGNVFKDLGFENADELQAEAILAYEIHTILKRRKLSQRQAAKLLGLDQADVNKLVNGRYTGFSLRRLVNLSNKLDRDVELVVKKRPRARSHATSSVRAV